MTTLALHPHTLVEEVRLDQRLDLSIRRRERESTRLGYLSRRTDRVARRVEDRATPSVREYLEEALYLRVVTNAFDARSVVVRV
mgnify:CR=1